MIEGTALDITRFLVDSVAAGSRTTYEKVAEGIGWGHPTGRGLGRHLYEVMHYCKGRALPPLTLIVVKKGTGFPSPDAMPHITEALGSIDIEAEQKIVLAFDWGNVPEFRPSNSTLPDGRAIWLTSFWGFSPDTWGCIGFATKAKRDYFIRRTRPGVIVAIYVTKGRGLEHERGKVLGFLEVSHIEGHVKDFVSGDQWAAKENDPTSRGKWLYSLKVTRAWRVAPEYQRSIDDLLPETYKSAHPEFIGAQGVPIKPIEVDNLLNLTVYEVPVYGQTDPIDSAIRPFEDVLIPSKAVYPSKEPYWVGETDGPKHLYILKLTGNTSHYLGRQAATLEDKLIVKVGFSKSPLSRRDQIQSAYPVGAFSWEVIYPKTIPENPPYPDAETAIEGEDAMKARMQKDGAECLGGEFFLADEGLVYRAWIAGKNAAEDKIKKAFGDSPQSAP